MRSIVVFFRDLLSKIFFGGDDPKSRLKQLNKLENKFIVFQRNNNDDLHNIIRKIRKYEKEALEIKNELKNIHEGSGEYQIVLSQIERIKSKIDGLNGTLAITSDNLERLDHSLERISEAKAALRAGVNEDQLDKIVLIIQDLYGDLDVLNKATKDLVNVEYKKAEFKDSKHIQQDKTVTTKKQQSSELSPETEEWLNRLKNVKPNKDILDEKEE